MRHVGACGQPSKSDANTLLPADRAAHDWYRFVLSFPPHVVRDYLTRFGVDGSRRVLDPFCGTGTTLIEYKKLGIPSIGVEANPVAYLASCTKTNWSVSPEGLLAHARTVAEATLARLRSDGIEDEPIFEAAPHGHRLLKSLPDERQKLLVVISISPVPLHKTLVLLEKLRSRRDEQFDAHERLALASALVHSIGNLRFGPEVGVGPTKLDAAVVAPWLTNIRAMACDLPALGNDDATVSIVQRADARQIRSVLQPSSIDAVITSPPYPNEMDYTRTTRLESILLSVIESKSDLQGLKKGLLRSNTRGVYTGDDDDQMVLGNETV